MKNIDKKKRKVYFIGYLIFLILLTICYFAIPTEHFYTAFWILVGLLAVFSIYLFSSPSSEE